jgi:hypothetical protein
VFAFTNLLFPHNSSKLISLPKCVFILTVNLYSNLFAFVLILFVYLIAVYPLTDNINIFYIIAPLKYIAIHIIAGVTSNILQYIAHIG